MTWDGMWCDTGIIMLCIQVSSDPCGQPPSPHLRGHVIEWRHLRPHKAVTHQLGNMREKAKMLMLYDVICTLRCEDIDLQLKRKDQPADERPSILARQPLVPSAFRPGLAWRTHGPQRIDLRLTQGQNRVVSNRCQNSNLASRCPWLVTRHRCMEQLGFVLALPGSHNIFVSIDRNVPATDYGLAMEGQPTCRLLPAPKGSRECMDCRPSHLMLKLGPIGHNS